MFLLLVLFQIYINFHILLFNQKPREREKKMMRISKIEINERRKKLKLFRKMCHMKLINLKSFYFLYIFIYF